MDKQYVTKQRIVIIRQQKQSKCAERTDVKHDMQQWNEYVNLYVDEKENQCVQEKSQEHVMMQTD